MKTVGWKEVLASDMGHGILTFFCEMRHFKNNFVALRVRGLVLMIQIGNLESMYIMYKIYFLSHRKTHSLYSG
jgi:hypothetical protein